ncbi:MAG TPA: hypothetical protein VMF89_14090 [Polyangiales bacterium]|nr:hypothetical protein [Polyangiales bacterium]
MAAKKTQKEILVGQGGPGRGQGRKRTLRQKVGETCSFVLTKTEKVQLKRWVEASGLSQSSYVRRALGFPVVSGPEAEPEE